MDTISYELAETDKYLVEDFDSRSFDFTRRGILLLSDIASYLQELQGDICE